MLLNDSITYISLLLALMAALAVIYFLIKLRRVELRYRILTSALSGSVVRKIYRQAELSSKTATKKRYMIVKVVGQGASREGLQEMINSSLTKLFGSSARSLAQPQVIYLNPSTMKAVIRYRARDKWRVLASLGALEGEALIIPLRVSGTFRKAKAYADMP